MAIASTAYVELQIASHFSFLRGASSPEELFAAAALLGHSAMGLADWNTVAGVVRGWDGQKTTGVRMIAGTRVELTDGRALLLYPRSRTAWSRLTRLLSIGKGRGGKGKCILGWVDVAAHADDMVGILLPDMPDEITAAHLRDLRDVLRARGFCALSLRRRPDVTKAKCWIRHGEQIASPEPRSVIVLPGSDRTGDS